LVLFRRTTTAFAYPNIREAIHFFAATADWLNQKFRKSTADRERMWLHLMKASFHPTF
jgi:hypothetical protein